MSDIAFRWNSLTQSADIDLVAFDLLSEDGFETAIVISLETDRRASKDDILPGGSTDRRGWWGDAFAVVPGDEIGSKMWLLKGRKIDAEVMRLAKEYAQQALAWMIADGVAASIDVTIERADLDRLNRRIVVTKPDGTSRQYDHAWSAYQ